jgi:hypothetical protein
MTAHKKLLVEIDHRCDLGSRFWRAVRKESDPVIGNEVKYPSACTVTVDCGATIQPGEFAAIWYFTRNADNSTEVGWLCANCDADLVGQTEEE